MSTHHDAASPTPEPGAVPEEASARRRNIPAAELPRKSVTGIIAVLAVAAFVMIMNETVLNVALPPLMHEFGVSATTVQWLTTGFLLTMAVVIPTTGFLLQRFSVRRLFLVALSLFLLGSVIAVAATGFPMMLLARVIQAGGTAIILPVLMTTTLTLVAPQHRGTVMGLNAVVIAAGPALGPAVSGLIIDAFGWRWVFGMMAIFAALTILAGLRLLPSFGGGFRVPLDLFSVVLSLLGFGGLVAALSTATEVVQGSLVPPVALVIGVVALALFIRRQIALQQDGNRAFLDLRPFQERNYTLSVVIIMVAMATLLGTVVVVPILAQHGLGISVMTTGLLLLPGGVLQAALSPVIGRIYDAVGPRWLVIPGTLLLSGVQWWLSTVDKGTTVTMLLLAHIVLSVGFALVLTPLMAHALSALPMNLYGHGSAALNTLQQLGGAIGTALLVGTLALGASAVASSEAAAQIAGAKTAFVVGGIMTLIGVVCAFFVKNRNRSE